jgi:ABC-type branched-subunit amino acid transport system ATPase component
MTNHDSARGKHRNRLWQQPGALFDLNLEIEKGKVAPLLGRNGMGKATTVLSIIGLNRIKSGRIFFNGERIDPLPADRIARLAHRHRP